MASKTNRQFMIFSVVIIGFIGVLMAFFVVRQVNSSIKRKGYSFEGENEFVQYPGFGISIPDNYQIHGIDVSRYQHTINWKLVKGMKDKGLEVSFAFMKATEGTYKIDPQFDRNWAKSKKVGMVRGAYHFFRQEFGGHEQAMFFIKKVKLESGDLPPVLDVERYSGGTNNWEKSKDEIAIWLKVVEDKYRVKPIIYTNAGFYKDHLAGRFDDYPLWVAHYHAPRQPRVFRNWTFWQHSEKGRMNGIRGFVDFNVFNGSPSEFSRLCIP